MVLFHFKSVRRVLCQSRPDDVDASQEIWVTAWKLPRHRGPTPSAGNATGDRRFMPRPP